MTTPGAVWGSFNAKTEDPEEVAETFVAPPQFWSLAEPGHVILVGPRGSGKTTLLKMLQLRALEAWSNERAEEARRRVSYTGVFVPADKAWGMQVAEIDERLDAQDRRDVGLGAFTLHALRALAGAALERCKPPRGDVTHPCRVQLDSDAQERIAREVGPQWGIVQPVGSLLALRHAVTDLLAELGRLVRGAQRDHKPSLAALHEHPALRLDFVASAVVFIERFNAAIDNEHGKWAFLLDELEVVPPAVRDQIEQSVRGTDPRLLFKLSMAPYADGSSSLNLPEHAMAGHDFVTENLTYAQKRGGYGFAADLLTALMRQRGLDGNPEDLLGRGSFEADDDDSPADYAPGGRAYEVLDGLRQIDPSYQEFLDNHGLSLDAAANMPESERAARLRKGISVATVRFAFGRPSQRPTPQVVLAARSAKSLELYTGAESLYAMCEANPRWLKAIALRLLEHVDGRGAVPRSDQARILVAAAEEYLGHLRVVPYVGDRRLAKSYAPWTVLDRLGTYFRAGVLHRRFRADPPMSVVVDAAATADLLATVRILINTGVLIHGSADVTGILSPSLIGRRFRLAHLFAPLYRLPLTLGHEVPLTAALTGAPPDQMTFDTDVTL